MGDGEACGADCFGVSFFAGLEGRASGMETVFLVKGALLGWDEVSEGELEEGELLFAVVGAPCEVEATALAGRTGPKLAMRVSETASF